VCDKRRAKGRIGANFMCRGKLMVLESKEQRSVDTTAFSHGPPSSGEFSPTNLPRRRLELHNVDGTVDDEGHTRAHNERLQSEKEC